MRHILLTSVLTISALLAPSSPVAEPVLDWSHRLGGPNQNTAYDVAVDGSGNVVVAGTFAGTMNVGGVTLTSAGSWDIFLAKYDAHGVHQWCRRFGDIGTDGARAVAVDGAGNIIMTGYFRAPVSFGGAPLTGNAAQDVFVAKFDAAGAHVWSRWYGSANGDEGQDVATDASGNVLVTGHYGGAIDFGAGAVTPAFGSLDAFVLKLNAAGVHQWSKGVGGLNPEAGYGVAVDAFNRVYVTGSFSGSVNFGGGALTSAGLTDVFVVKYGEDGSHQWSARMGGTGSDSGQGVGVDATGGIAVTGVHNGTFLAAYDTDGVPRWNRNFSGTDMVQGLDLAVGAGAIAITGNLRGTADLGAGPLSSAGDDDIFFALYNDDGTHRWSRRFGNTGDDWGYGCAFDASGNLVAAGVFSASVDFGGGALVSAGLNDVYLVKFDDHVADTTPPQITCPAGIEVPQTAPDGAPASDPAIAAFLAGASATDDVDPAPAISHNAPAVFPVGTTTVTFLAGDASGNSATCTSTVTVLDATAPLIAVVLDHDLLWPPNHKFVTVCAEVTVSDNDGGEPAFTLVSITSNEPADGRGDGHTGDDVRNAEFGTADLCFDLRAERAGNGDGRVYEVVYATSDAAGNAAYDTAYVRVAHDMSGDAPVPPAQLRSVHPNPFNPQTTLEYALTADGRVSMTIYDARGAVVRRLVDRATPAGDHFVTWDGVDDHGRPVGSGIYFVKLVSGSHADTRKIVLLK